MKYKYVVFDMDGTVLDTLEDLKDALNYSLKRFSFPERTLSEVRSFVGNGIPKLIERALPYGVSEKTRKDVYDAFTPYYKEHCTDKTKSYDGINALLDKLKSAGLYTCVVSNKDDYAVKELVNVYFPGGFDYAVGRLEGIEKKPAPDMVNKALKFFGAEKSEAVYVGDSDVDYLTAANADLDFIGVSWGFRGKEFLKNLGASVIADSAEELFDYIIKS